MAEVFICIALLSLDDGRSLVPPSSTVKRFGLSG
jgi:hypothetical protein